MEISDVLEVVFFHMVSEYESEEHLTLLGHAGRSSLRSTRIIKGKRERELG